MLVEYFLRNKFGHGFNSHHLHQVATNYESRTKYTNFYKHT